MKFFERIKSTTSLRNITIKETYFSSFFKKRGDFTIFFEYKIGRYRDDYFLYFNKIPSGVAYRNAIFNKIYKLSDLQIEEFLAFHYEKYDNKNAFLRFLYSELYNRLEVEEITQKNDYLNYRNAIDGYYTKMLVKYTHAFKWVNDMFEQNRLENIEFFYNNFLLGHIKTIIENHFNSENCPKISISEMSELNKEVKRTINAELLKIQDQSSIIELLDLLKSKEGKGNIHGDYKAIELLKYFLIALKGFYFSKDDQSSIKLFDKFSDKDVSLILINNLALYKNNPDKKPETLRKEIQRMSTDYRKNQKLISIIDVAIQQVYEALDT